MAPSTSRPSAATYVRSAYKFFGPHAGILWGRREILEQLQPDKVRPASDDLPGRFETGTQNHEALAGIITAAVDYLASLGARAGEPFAGQFPAFSGRRRDLKLGLNAIRAYERELCWWLIEGLQEVQGLHIWGITDPAHADRRVPTVDDPLRERFLSLVEYRGVPLAIVLKAQGVADGAHHS